MKTIKEEFAEEEASIRDDVKAKQDEWRTKGLKGSEDMFYILNEIYPRIEKLKQRRQGIARQEYTAKMGATPKS
jgi:hypothetical protein